jgi:uncharacterized membrane protein (UPF0127 family)
MLSHSPMSAVNATRGTRLSNDVRIAKTHWTRLCGLIGTAAQDFQFGQALWIVPCRGVHTFGMRFALDLIYLDRSGNVVEVLENVGPWRIAPVHFGAASVLELPAGAIHTTGTRCGDRIEIAQAAPVHEAAA